jgi:hypothetical protein
MPIIGTGGGGEGEGAAEKHVCTMCSFQPTPNFSSPTV